MADPVIIPIADQRYASSVPAVPSGTALASLLQQAPGVADKLQRPLRDLRISVTDRCNFRCSYCMPSEVFDKDYAYLPQSSLLSFEEITRVARLFTRMGVQKIRLTGGEPLLRKNLPQLIQQLSALRTLEGKPLDITLTTNGSLLAQKAQALKDAGLQRLTVSLDALDDGVFRQMNDVDFPVAEVLQGLQVAQQVGFKSIKINMVVKRGTNEQQILPMVQHFKGSGLVLRFIEFMDVGATNGWRMDEVLSSQEVMQRIHAHYPLQEMPALAAGETAKRYGFVDGSGELGFISSVTQAFCHECNRARLSTEGKLYLCLFAHHGHDVRSLLRQHACSDDELLGAMMGVWAQRDDRYSALRALMPADAGPPGQRVEMSYIGG